MTDEELYTIFQHSLIHALVYNHWRRTDSNDTAFTQSSQHPIGYKLCQQKPALSKAPIVPLFSVLVVKFLALWLERRYLLLARDVDSNPGPTSVCVARPHAGAGASAHVLNHTTTPTQHSTPTQANNKKLATTHHTTQSKHHKQQAYPYYK